MAFYKVFQGKKHIDTVNYSGHGIDADYVRQSLINHDGYASDIRVVKERAKPEMTASKLKAAHEAAFPSSRFFSRNNMKFAGDTMANFGVKAVKVTTTYDADDNYVESGIAVEAWELYRRKSVNKGAAGKVAYFAKEDFRELNCVTVVTA